MYIYMFLSTLHNYHNYNTSMHACIPTSVRPSIRSSIRPLIYSSGRPLIHSSVHPLVHSSIHMRHVRCHAWMHAYLRKYEYVHACVMYINARRASLYVSTHSTCSSFCFRKSKSCHRSRSVVFKPCDLSTHVWYGLLLCPKKLQASVF